MNRRFGLLAIFAALVVVLLVPTDAFAANIGLAWNPSPGTVGGYIVYWGTQPASQTGGVYPNQVDVGLQTSQTIQGLTNGTRYYFVVRAYSGGLLSAPSNEVNGLPGSLLFTDDPLVPGVHSMRAVHMSELRARIDALRTARGLGGMSWTNLVAGSTVITASHLTELRSALNAVYQSLGLPLPVYTETPQPGTPIRATHITQLRAFVTALE